MEDSGFFSVEEDAAAPSPLPAGPALTPLAQKEEMEATPETSVPVEVSESSAFATPMDLYVSAQTTPLSQPPVAADFEMGTVAATGEDQKQKEQEEEPKPAVAAAHSFSSSGDLGMFGATSLGVDQGAEQSLGMTGILSGVVGDFFGGSGAEQDHEGAVEDLDEAPKQKKARGESANLVPP